MSSCYSPSGPSRARDRIVTHASQGESIWVTFSHVGEGPNALTP